MMNGEMCDGCARYAVSSDAGRCATNSSASCHGGGSTGDGRVHEMADGVLPTRSVRVDVVLSEVAAAVGAECIGNKFVLSTSSDDDSLTLC